jgi:tetratricopeptide (TPR) repeat protein
MTALSRPRRVLVAATALGAALVTFHGPLASGLVTRGDDFLRSGQLDAAIGTYGRATVLDATSATAADRLAFALLLRRRAGDARRAFAIADDVLRRRPADAALLVDRGFAAQRLARWRIAERSFVSAAWIAHDPRYAQLAARMAQRARDLAGARHDFHLALALRPGYPPARAALRELP